MNWYRTAKIFKAMNWYRTAKIFKAASIDLQKLYRLFKSFSKGLQEENLLFEVYYDWLDFLKRGKADVVGKLEEVEVAKLEYEESPNDDTKQNYEDTSGNYAGLEEVLERIDRAINIMEDNYEKSFKEKMIALNIAISIYHRDVSVLEHYLRRYYDQSIKEFLDWLHVQNIG